MSGPGAPTSSGSRRGRLLATSIIAVLVAVIVTTLIVALTTDEDPSSTADATTTSTGSPTPTEDLPAGGILDGAGGSNSDREAGPAAPADEAELRELIPLDFSASNCTPSSRPADDGSLAALACGPSISSPGANASDFLLYAEEADVVAAFEDYAQERALGELPAGNAAGCGQNQGFASYAQGGPVLGELACFIDSENTAFLVWTNTDFNVFAITSAASGDAEGLRALYDWWVVRGQITRR